MLIRVKRPSSPSLHSPVPTPTSCGLEMLLTMIIPLEKSISARGGLDRARVMLGILKVM
jgi:hypothetical protein